MELRTTNRVNVVKIEISDLRHLSALTDKSRRGEAQDLWIRVCLGLRSTRPGQKAPWLQVASLVLNGQHVMLILAVPDSWSLHQTWS